MKRAGFLGCLCLAGIACWCIDLLPANIAYAQQKPLQKVRLLVATGVFDVTYSEFLTRLMRAQWHARQEHALEWRIRTAKLPERWSLDTFPFPRQPGVNRKQIRTFAELEFIDKKENIVFIGTHRRR